MFTRNLRHFTGQTTSAGFTLIEMILVIVLLGILSLILVVFILTPFQAARDMALRADLVDAADLALNRITREVRSALPNSVRVHAAGHVEFIDTVTGGRYRRLPAPDGSGDMLVPARNSDSFDVLGPLVNAAAIQTRGPGNDCGGGGGCLSIYNTGQSGFNAYDGDNLAAVTAVSTSSLSYDRGSSGPAFATHSPQQRFFVTRTVVSYRCVNNELRRYSGYGLTSGVPALPDEGGELVVDGVSGCQFSYTAGTSSRRGLLSLQIELSRDDDAISLLGQAQVLNSP